jgi:hypothetical protein
MAREFGPVWVSDAKAVNNGGEYPAAPIRYWKRRPGDNPEPGDKLQSPGSSSTKLQHGRPPP